MRSSSVVSGGTGASLAGVAAAVMAANAANAASAAPPAAAAAAPMSSAAMNEILERLALIQSDMRDAQQFRSDLRRKMEELEDRSLELRRELAERQAQAARYSQSEESMRASETSVSLDRQQPAPAPSRPAFVDQSPQTTNHAAAAAAAAAGAAGPTITVSTPGAPAFVPPPGTVALHLSEATLERMLLDSVERALSKRPATQLPPLEAAPRPPAVPRLVLPQQDASGGGGQAHDGEFLSLPGTPVSAAGASANSPSRVAWADHPMAVLTPGRRGMADMIVVRGLSELAVPLSPRPSSEYGRAIDQRGVASPTRSTAVSAAVPLPGHLTPRVTTLREERIIRRLIHPHSFDPAASPRDLGGESGASSARRHHGTRSKRQAYKYLRTKTRPAQPSSETERDD